MHALGAACSPFVFRRKSPVSCRRPLQGMRPRLGAPSSFTPTLLHRAQGISPRCFLSTSSAALSTSLYDVMMLQPSADASAIKQQFYKVLSSAISSTAEDLKGQHSCRDGGIPTRLIPCAPYRRLSRRYMD